MKFKSNIGVQAGIEDNNDLTGDSGQILSSTGSGVTWIDQSAVTSATDFVFFNVKNETGSTILKGKGVMAVGTDGNSGHILIDEMFADGGVEPKYFLGVLEENIANGGFARVISFGQLSQFDTRGQNGETWADGQILWCDPSNPGDFTITEPDGPNVKIAAVIILNSSTNGKIQVRVQANEGIHDLHDTKITSQVDGDVLVWDNTTGVWFNDSTLNVDYTAGNVGIGTTSPSYRLTAYGSSTDSEIVASFGSGNDQNEYTAIGLSGFIASNGATKAGLALKRTGVYGTGELHFLNNNTLDNSDMTLSDSKMMINSSGNVGIGTTDPLAKLHIDVVTEDNQPALKITKVSDAGENAMEVYHGTSSSARGIADFTNSLGSVMFLRGDGNVGIGTTSPSTKLDVAGNANISDTLAIGSLSTVPTASLGRALNIQVLANSSGTTVAQWLDIDRTITTDSTSAATYGMVLRNASTTTSTANDGKIYGAQIIGRHQGTGDINSAMGVRGTADIDTTGNITATGTLWGAYNEAQVTNGSVTFTNSGIFGTASRGQVLGSGTVNITSQGVVGGVLIGVLNNVNATVNRVVGGQFELDLQNGTTDKAHVVSLNTFNIVSPTNLSIDEFAYIYLGEDVAIPTTITDNAYFIKSLTSLPSELAGSIEATSFIKTGGTSSQFLKADGSIDSTSYAPATGGSYLPLSAGSSYPLTGDLIVSASGNTNLILQNPGGAGNSLLWWKDSSGGNDWYFGQTAENGNLNLYNYTSALTQVQFKTNGVVDFGGTIAVQGTGNSYFQGNVGIGTTSPLKPLQVDGAIAAQRSGVEGVYARRELTGSGHELDVPSGYHSLLVKNNGSEQLRITSAGNVGIGTTSPSTLLHISNPTSGGDVASTIENGSGTIGSSSSTNYMVGGSSLVNAKVSAIRMVAGGITDLAFSTYSGGLNERMRITSAGNVGIGTTSPGAVLQVGEATGITGALSAKAKIVVDAANTTDINNVLNLISKYNGSPSAAAGSGPALLFSGGIGDAQTRTYAKIVGKYSAYNMGGLAFHTQDTADIITEKMTILPSSGNVGIGTTSPTHLLTLETASSPSLKIKDTTQGATLLAFSQDSDSHLGTYSAHPLVLDTNSTERMRITSAGNVGIGTTSPGTKLHVSAASSNSQLTLERTGSATGKYSIYTNTNNLIINNVAANTYPLTILNNGNVGIGTISPAYKLEVSGNAALSIGADRYLRIGSSTNYWWDLQSVSNDFTLKEAGSNTRLIVKAGGNVGIGATSPQSKLQVNGGVQMADDTDTASADKVGTMRYRTGTEYVEVTGTELITNGDFATDTDWSKNSGVTISGGTMNFTSTAGHYGSQNINFTNGAKYKINFEITAETSGTLTVFLGAGNNVGSISGVGKKEIIATGNSSLDTNIYFGNNFTGSIDNVSIVEVTEENASYADMCMQTGASTYEWVNIVRNTY